MGHNPETRKKSAEDKMGSVADRRQSVCPIQSEVCGEGVCACDWNRRDNDILSDVIERLAKDGDCYLCKIRIAHEADGRTICISARRDRQAILIELQEIIYEEDYRRKYVGHLRKALYGLRQAPLL
jgi:hypothetical protein